jgi:hypothetical protein
MDNRTGLIIRVLMNRYDSQGIPKLLKFLPEQQQKFILEESTRSKDLAPILEDPFKVLKKIHYSWLKPIVEKLPKEWQLFAVSIFTTEQQIGLKIPIKYKSTPFVQKFIRNQLYQMLECPQHIPISYLPTSVFSPLVEYSKQQMVEIIDLLGMYDLASALRHVLDQNQLKQVYECLSAKQKEQMAFPKIDLAVAKQGKEFFKRMIHRRGLIRLGRAMVGQHKDLLWHIKHVLDVGRGTILTKESQEKVSIKVVFILKQQVSHTMNFLKANKS